MKRIIVCVLFAVMATCAFSQEMGKIRGGLDLGGCRPGGSGVGGGVLVDIPLGYNLQDNMNVGIKMGAAVMAKADPFGESGSASVNVNFLATYTYYFNSGTSPFAPFVGCGAGLYSLAAASADMVEVTVDVGNKFGGMLTAGFELAKFRMALQYNLVPSSGITVTSTSVAPSNTSIKNSYLGLTLGFYVGGGKWKK